MKLYYIAPLEVMHEHSELFSESHAFPLHDGRYIMGVFFRNSGAVSKWEEVEGVIPLPHPLSGRAISPEIAQALSDFGVLPSDTTYDVAEKMGKHHKLLRLASF